MINFCYFRCSNDDFPNFCTENPTCEDSFNNCPLVGSQMFSNMTRCTEYQSGQTSLSLYCSYICDNSSDFEYNECMYTSQVCPNSKQFDLEDNCSLISSTWFKNYDQCANYSFSFNRTRDDSNGGSVDFDDIWPVIVMIISSCIFICLIYMIVSYCCQAKSKILMSLVILYMYC